MPAGKPPVRRNVLSAAVAASLTALALGPARSSDSIAARDPWTRLRRVVTTNDAAGQGIVMFDGEPGNSIVMNGTRVTRLWEVPAVPATTPFTADLGAIAGNAYRDGFQGASFYIAELPGGRRAPQIPMHATPSVDFMAILAGRVALRLDSGEVILRQGDTLVQGGNLHTWVNRWREPCLLLFVVLSAQRAHQPIP
ncbi:MAG TPA: hypothetical protein P5528_11460 [Steroidobacteraceae bacterium]|nr:hypothetical protein [Steroidobacteraceae bacterium]HRX90049.1 hypothetical protein [Steroidobacteraceae bacterium]